MFNWQSKFLNGELSPNEIKQLEWQRDRMDYTMSDLGQWEEGEATLFDAAIVFDQLENEE